MKEKILPNKEQLHSTDKGEYAEFIGKNLPSFGSKATDDALNPIKAELFLKLFDLTKNSGPSFDSEIIFDGFMEDCRDLFYQVAPSLKLLERAKEA